MHRKFEEEKQKKMRKENIRGKQIKIAEKIGRGISKEIRRGRKLKLHRKLEEERRKKLEQGN